MAKKRVILPVHPGTVLLEEFLLPMGISDSRLAKDINVHVGKLRKIIDGKEDLTLDIAVRIALFFKMSVDFWLGLQKDYELDVAKISLTEKLKKEVHPWPGHLVHETI